ncbi:DNA-formamidopyrimidine glycosylase family protein [Pseudarthrobacter sp. AL07]|uniref:Fpg/Nei family DNA glycosylase n=1 Tax=unclassified Pseudarthrobacter TaxID=2647000 RepID=UPI00249A6983|nr:MULTISPECIES: DNA-formamidopyrimidine glycosylase family protein [unclassified Pseudarthrobacter]MDI3195126.1 DNA-formamidopyrimidine glycosylase family protein [Pseudarthrobacter sp. AL20]MDI3209192.1 DNA-formamidopyrimidine glycosylase family protein [Pseudarthrobacter sp. AL07]
MPEGHSVRRLAQQFGDVFTGESLSVSSPQGRFAAGAALLDGQVLTESRAHGKHLFLHFDHAVVLHVHLGLYGAWDFGGDATFRGASSIGAPRKIGEREVFEDRGIVDGAGTVEYSGPPEPKGAVRVRLVSQHGWADLRGATTCAAITEAEARAVLARLGPDPLHNRPVDRGLFVTGLLSRKTPIAALLMDQKVIAGVGNVYRAEVLFRQGLDPWLPGTALSGSAAGLLWDDTAAVMADGVRDGRIITTPPVYWELDRRERGYLHAGAVPPAAGDAHFVYKREGQPCRVCAVPVAITEMVGRKLYWCPGCQQ